METEWKEESFLSIREHAYLYLKDKILKGDYKAGDRLIERELASQLAISRTPIREALFRLESQGFVKTVPRRGVIVVKVSEEEVIEVFTILSSLEVLAAKLAAQRMDDKMQRELDEKINQLLEQQEQAEEQFSSEHIQMNHLLNKAAKSPKLFEILSGLTDYIHMAANMGYETPGRKRESLKEHLEIMKALRNKETEMAEYLMRIHIENSKKAYISYMESLKEKQKA
ncbi:GntR family transcriptional regulator [Bacillus thermotolerans]|uniref:Transcriptional regulator, GntR family n=1 Tax=Bacillus thermotolerans TaxID=1221996 RepID=A0A0F5HTK7_BACTR|nr:GntR family transcriptional regulator [Bacillus thermotolerans]KKB36626.1 Transcriptional regulator, GntR family [Bacillus thermotolerans]KKB40622.1 Transcriptional regulator, GntR family [Bacillus thermotolerans]KKB41283.1 Transcriptional regulator, GntR family [Bacillus thermotolerans]